MADPVELPEPDELVVVDEPPMFGQPWVDAYVGEPELDDVVVVVWACAGITERTPIMAKVARAATSRILLLPSSMFVFNSVHLQSSGSHSAN